jgi:hypothetical protein
MKIPEPAHIKVSPALEARLTPCGVPPMALFQDVLVSHLRYAQSMPPGRDPVTRTRLRLPAIGLIDVMILTLFGTSEPEPVTTVVLTSEWTALTGDPVPMVPAETT